jgi:glutamate--cysteine ligase
MHDILGSFHCNKPIIYRGIEKENLRINTDGSPAKSSHPQRLGSALKNPVITTDFAECLPEIITGIHGDIDSLLDELQDLNIFLLQAIPNNEILWPASMPPWIASNNDLPIAEYGSSNVAMMKHLYRIGLSNRYGNIMQSIAGIHYNISFCKEFIHHLNDNSIYDKNISDQEIKSNFYMQLVRNFIDSQWLLLYLFAAAPVAMRSSLGNIIPEYIETQGNVCLSKYATSLRLSPIGYHNAEQNMQISYNSVQQYASDLMQLTHKESKIFADIPDITSPNPKQLNKNILQIENEYYNTIRPKPKFTSNRMPAISLYDNGVEYVEIRIFDLNPFIPLGINKEQIAFTDVFLTYCLIHTNMQQSAPDIQRINNNTKRVLTDGYNPKCYIEDSITKTPIKTAVLNKLNALIPVAEFLDRYNKTKIHTSAVAAQLNKLNYPNNLTNNKLLDLTNNYQNNILNLAKSHSEYLRNQIIKPEKLEELNHIAKTSLAEQKVLERNDKNINFKDYYDHYQLQAKDFFSKMERGK